MELQELKVLNRKFEVCSWRAEAGRQKVLESGECWKAKARSVSEEDLNDPEFLEWKYWRDEEKRRWGAWWRGKLVQVAQEGSAGEKTEGAGEHSGGEAWNGEAWKGEDSSASIWDPESGWDATSRCSRSARTPLSSSGTPHRWGEKRLRRCQSTKAYSEGYPPAGYPYQGLSQETAAWQHLAQLERATSKSDDATVASGSGLWFYFVPEMHDLERGYSWMRFCPHHSASTPCQTCQYAGERAVACSSLGQPSAYL